MAGTGLGAGEAQAPGGGVYSPSPYISHAFQDLHNRTLKAVSSTSHDGPTVYVSYSFFCVCFQLHLPTKLRAVNCLLLLKCNNTS